MATETATLAAPTQNDRWKIFLHALLFVAGFSLVFIVGWGGSITVLGQLFVTYKSTRPTTRPPFRTFNRPPFVERSW